MALVDVFDAELLDKAIVCRGESEQLLSIERLVLRSLCVDKIIEGVLSVRPDAFLGSSMLIYLNDAQVGRTDGVIALNWSSSYIGTEIGNNTFDTNATYVFAGAIDEVVISTTKPGATPVCTNPGSFALTSPANGATGISTTPTLTWHVATGAGSYIVHIGNSNPPSSNNDQAVTTTSFSPASSIIGALGAGLTYYWSVDAVASCNNSLRTTDTGGIQTFTTAGVCTLSCTATAPLSGSTAVPVNFTANATPSLSCSPVAYTWDFGDGSALSSVENPRHLYTTVASYKWSLTMSAGGTTCRKNGFITVTAPTMAAPPIILVYGYCGDTDTWNGMVANLQKINAARYDGTVVHLYYDGTQVRVYGTDSATIPFAPLYGIVYYDAVNKTFDKSYIADVPIRTLGYQLQSVIAAVVGVTQRVTGATQVDIISHSMGGLVARIVVEGLAAPYAGTVRNLITLDTPHMGTNIASWANIPALQCIGDPNSLQRVEMDPTRSDFIASLNSYPIPSTVHVLAVATTIADPGCLNECPISPEGDLIVAYPSQDLTCQASHDVGAACQSIYDCQPNIVVSRQLTGDAHATLPFVRGVYDDYTIAQLVDQQLADPQTSVVCADVPAGNTLSVAAPTTTSSYITMITSFTTGVGKTSLASCTADITALNSTGIILATAEVTAVGTQSVTLGIINDNDWHIEIRPTCAVSLTAVITAAPATARRRAVSH